MANLFISQRLLKEHQDSLLKFSTLPNEERWWRLEINNEDLRWIQENLGHGIEGGKRFEILPKNIALSGALYDGCPWIDRVAFVTGEEAPRVLVGLGDAYNYRSAYAAARERCDPYLSPHGQFRNLEAGYHKHAVQFMQKFGPLHIDSASRLSGDSWWLSLDDFWNRHARFVAVAKLWEDRFDPANLRERWASIAEQHERLDRAGDAPLGYIPDPIRKYVRFCQMPWQMGPDSARSFEVNGFMRQRLVYELVQAELILHTQNCVSTWLPRMESESEPLGTMRFEPTRCFRSLWGAIWELFGLDTRQYGWRLCELCGRLFYPKDRRSVCCCSEHQSLWSKREWARKHRAEVRNKRKHKKAR